MTKLNLDKIPQHIAIIMDGNRRWAKERGLPGVAGHKKVVSERIEELIEAAGEAGIPYITFWAWSSENWTRPSTEVKAIMRLFRWALTHKAKKMIERGARLRVIGNWQALEPDIVQGIKAMIEKSKDNTKINVTYAINYGGRDELIRAVNKLQATGHKPQEWKRDHIEKHLDTSGMPDPDLIIRPGGEQRLSGFMLWQSEYAELYFPQVMMPDFGKQEFHKALAEYTKRQRRFGGS